MVYAIGSNLNVFKVQRLSRCVFFESFDPLRTAFAEFVFYCLLYELVDSFCDRVGIYRYLQKHGLEQPDVVAVAVCYQNSVAVGLAASDAVDTQRSVAFGLFRRKTCAHIYNDSRRRAFYFRHASADSGVPLCIVICIKPSLFRRESALLGRTPIKRFPHRGFRLSCLCCLFS